MTALWVTLSVAGYSVALACVLGMGRRNQRVSRYRGDLIDLVHRASLIDIDRDFDWRWRWDAYDAVSYDRMLLRFWIPLDEFYPDKSFTSPGTIRPNKAVTR